MSSRKLVKVIYMEILFAVLKSLKTKPEAFLESVQIKNRQKSTQTYRPFSHLYYQMKHCLSYRECKSIIHNYMALLYDTQ